MVSIRFGSLRARLVALIVLAALPTLGLVVFAYVGQRRGAAQEGREAALRVARDLIRAHEQHLGEARRLLVTLAAMPETRMANGAACGARYAAILREFPDMTALGAAAASGDVTCSAPMSQSVNVADRPWFERAARTRAFTTGDHEIDPTQAAAGRRVPSALIRAAGRNKVVFGALDLGWVGRFAAAAELPPDWAVALSDDRGTILARHPDPWKWVGQRLPEASLISAAVAEKGEGTAEVEGADGVVRLLGFAPVPGPPGTRRAFLSVALPRAAAFAAAQRTFLWNLFGLGLVTAAGVMAAWWGSEWLVLRRVKTLADATTRLATGDLEARAEVTGRDEIGALARELNGMATRVSVMVGAEREARLVLAGRVDSLVTERTREVELLRQLSELLQACATPDEAHAVMGQLCGRLFPDAAGQVLVTPASRDGLWAVAVWGPPLAAGRERFQLDDCWALRRGRVYRVDDVSASPACLHLGPPNPPAFVCVPLAAQGRPWAV
jgi:HAMP domain-containing protein